jgi:8-oxo-dGTP pyrophosphatase MutT (NUDIX family)
MEYIQFLRQHIGHAPILMVGAVILIVDDLNRLLLMRRLDNGCWGPPGGGTEPGEEVEEAARRETREEIGLQVGEMSLFGVFSGPELYYKYPNGDEVYNVSIVYLSKDITGDIRLNGEHTEWGWFAPAEVPGDLSPPIKPMIERFIRSIQAC